MHGHVYSSRTVQGLELHQHWRPTANSSKVLEGWRGSCQCHEAWVPQLFSLLSHIPLCQDPLCKSLVRHFLLVPTMSTPLGCWFLVEGIVVMLLGCLGRSRWSGHWLDWLSGRVASSLESCVCCVCRCVFVRVVSFCTWTLVLFFFCLI
jgi:hypothetical protein